VSTVEPFPVIRCRHFLDMVRCHVASQPAAKRKAYLRQLIEQHRQFLASVGVAPGLVDRECRDLERAVSAPPNPQGGLRLAA
jgi:hypothetical protein